MNPPETTSYTSKGAGRRMVLFTIFATIPLLIILMRMTVIVVIGVSIPIIYNADPKSVVRILK